MDTFAYSNDRVISGGDCYDYSSFLGRKTLNADLVQSCNIFQRRHKKHVAFSSSSIHQKLQKFCNIRVWAQRNCSEVF